MLDTVEQALRRQSGICACQERAAVFVSATEVPGMQASRKPLKRLKEFKWSAYHHFQQLHSGGKGRSTTPTATTPSQSYTKLLGNVTRSDSPGAG